MTNTESVQTGGGVAKSETARREEEVLAFWNERQVFEQTLAKEAPRGEFVFYDGPPFATGVPHVGHLLGSSIKDVVGRYKTMCGYHVPRRWGWDTHGLPIENIVEKKLALKTKKDIEVMGIDRFNEAARATVLEYVEDWRTYVMRIGRWVDFDHSYKTMDNAYVESVWWALKKIHGDGRLYEGKKVLMYGPHCETPLSKAEIAMDNSYKDVAEEAVFVKFHVPASAFQVDGPVYILAWTTTPWTLPGNVALAINPDLTYALVRAEHVPTPESVTAHDPSLLILLLSRVDALRAHGYALTVEREISGSDLVGLSYEPLYEIPKAQAANTGKAWTILPADFVTTEDGTGVVHIAPMYGEDDYELGRANDLPMVQLLDATGTYSTDAPPLVQGMFYKKGGKSVMKDLEARGLLFATHSHTHSYPHCYRCGTALIYNALTSWFINIQAVKQRLLDANEDVSWYPEHLKQGRFRNIVEGAPDWTISRNRYWASPLPIWKHPGTGAVTVIGSVEDLRAHTKRNNRYLIMRHGRAESNDRRVISTEATDPVHLTDEGKKQVAETAEQLKRAGVTKIIASPFVRTRETAAIVAASLEYDAGSIVFDDRLGEWRLGALQGHAVSEIISQCPTVRDRFTVRCGAGAETLVEMKQRIGDALYAYESTYTNETILLVGHEYTAWMAACVARGADTDACIELRGTDEDFIRNGEVRELDFVPLPHNAHYELDLHRPYIDAVSVLDEHGDVLERIPEVVDCWVESGLMPVASEHRLGEPLGRPDRFPGDFIAEYIAQTRTWFYYTHAMGVLLFDGHSFRNCVTTGTILAEDGSKMSKSKGNFTDPLLNLDRFGADALRLYLLGSVVMQSEDMSFRDEELKEVHNRVIGILWNTYKFYEMYGATVPRSVDASESTHVLDVWVCTRLNEVVREVTECLDAYDTVRSIRVLRDFITDLSTWYLRRSRDRFKSDDVADRNAAVATTRSVLLTLATLLAPIAPFIAESIYRGVGGARESVHLAPWPEAGAAVDPSVMTRMDETRSLVSQALELRSRANVKIRQPLAALTLPESYRGIVHDQLILDEVNVKTIVYGGELALDTTLTDDLKREGDVRELVRAVQDMRKRAALLPEDRIVLSVRTSVRGDTLVAAAGNELARAAGVLKIVALADAAAGTEIVVDEETFTCVLVKA